jgi:hypothetical protein
MGRFLLVAAVLASPMAFATGERVVLTPPDQPLRAALCVSMTCVTSGAREATVASREVRGGLEVTVTLATGERRLSHLVPLNGAGRPGAADVLRAATLVIQAIEQGPARKGAPRPLVRRSSARGGAPRG